MNLLTEWQSYALEITKRLLVQIQSLQRLGILITITRARNCTFLMQVDESVSKMALAARVKMVRRPMKWAEKRLLLAFDGSSGSSVWCLEVPGSNNQGRSTSLAPEFQHILA
jgi:hypothetical protein